jgi:pimeloyl-ACP methyl ester carboxylesterase
LTRSGKLKWSAGFLLILVVMVSLAFWMRPLSFYHAFAKLGMWRAGAQSSFVTVAGRRVHYYATGPSTGRPVVLVHGLGGRSEDWRYLVPYLVKAGYRVYALDLPGYGQSDRPADFSYSVPAEAAVVVAFLDALSLRQIDLGGWSMGGWIVQRVAGDHPERVSRLILFDSAGINERPLWDTRLFTPATPAEVDQLDVLLMPHPPRVPDFVAQDILRSSRRNGWVIHRALDSMLSGHDTTDDLLPRLQMPVQIVWGSEDRITPLSQGEKMHRLVPQSQLDVIQGCGHLAPGQCATEIGPKVVEFLNR